MSRVYTEEELNDPNLFANISKEEKEASLQRAIKLNNSYKESNSIPVNIKLRRKARKK